YLEPEEDPLLKAFFSAFVNPHCSLIGFFWTKITHKTGIEMQTIMNRSMAVIVVFKSPKNERLPKGVFTLISSARFLLETFSLAKYPITETLSIFTTQIINKNMRGTPRKPLVKGNRKIPCKVLNSWFTTELSPLNSLVYSENLNNGLM